jgi:hypothetical protein
MKFKSNQFKKIWAVDFEFYGNDGDLPTPVCLVAKELISGQLIRIWQDDFSQMRDAPFDTGKDSLFVAYYASAEISCHLVLNWTIPFNILDLFCEFRVLTNGKLLPCGRGLVGALTYFGLSNMEALKKDAMRELILSGGPWDAEEQGSILMYCQQDVDSLALLLEVMIPKIDLEYALLRGQYMASCAKIENVGVPCDVQRFNLFLENWDNIRQALINKFNANYQIYNGLSFRSENFAKWLLKKNISWPCLDSGALDLKDDTFREMARAHPEVAPLRELRVTLFERPYEHFGSKRPGVRSRQADELAIKTRRPVYFARYKAPLE